MTQYSPTFTYAYSPCLLPHWQPSGDWCGSDTQQLYRINLEQQPPGWDWQDRPVSYVWNREGYRAPQWSTVDWPNTHVIMGCSYVMGVGINEPDTLSCQLMTQLDQPVVNLGYSGGSAHIIQYNTMRMKELGWRPKSVTIAIPDANRLTYFEQFDVTNFTSGLLNSKNPTGVLKFYEYWTRPPQHAELYARMAIKGAEAMWLNMGVPVILRHASAVKGASQMAPNWAEVVDYARDQRHNGAGQLYGHPGPATMALRARELADEIRLL